MKDIDDIWKAVCELAGRDNAAPLNALPGCWYRRIDERWEIALNGHKEPMRCEQVGVTVEPFRMYVQFNGWPAGVLSPFGGEIAAGELANIDTFCAALEAASRA